MIVLLLFVGFVVSQCDRIRVRRDVRDLTSDQRTRYLDAFRKLHIGGFDSPLFKLTSTHVNNSGAVHGGPVFLPWHRQFVHLFQKEIEKIDSSVVVPYWDWTRDSKAPHLSPVFNWFGGNGRPSDGCVVLGRSPLQVLAARSGVERHCLRRRFDNNGRISAFVEKSGIQQVMARSDFWDFARRLEAQPHAAPHNNLGGDMSSMAAPNDPVFWLHHAMIDRIYTSWQVSNPNKYIPDGEDEPLPVYSDTSVKDTFDTRAYPYCYEYATLISSNSPNDIPHPRSPNPQQLNFGPGQPNPNSNFATTPRPRSRLQRRSNTVQQEATSTIHLEVQPGVSLTIDLAQIANETNAWALLQRICPTTLCPTEPIKSQLLHLPRPVNEGWIKNNNYPILNFRFYEIQYAIHIYNKNLEISRKPKKCKPKRKNLLKY